MDKGRLHRQFARLLSKLFETAISEATLSRSRFYFVGCLAKQDGPRRTTRHARSCIAIVLRGIWDTPGIAPKDNRGPSVLAFKLVAIDKGTPPSVEFPVPYLEVRDRESPCRCSAVSFFVCCPGMPRAELTPLRQKRSRAVRRGL